MPTSLSSPAALSDTLRALLDAQLNLPAEYRDQLTSHLPMALHALHSLGASPLRLHAFYAIYAKRFDGMHAPTPVQPAASIEPMNALNDFLSGDLPSSRLS